VRAHRITLPQSHGDTTTHVLGWQTRPDASAFLARTRAELHVTFGWRDAGSSHWSAGSAGMCGHM